MQTSVKTKIGPFLVISSVLAVWTFLAVQPVQAHTLTDPSCSGLPTATDFFEAGETAALTAGATVNATATPKKGTGRTGEGRTAHYYARITLPALTAGELMVTANSNNADAPSEAALCRGSTTLASSRPSYASAHNSANTAADAAASAQAAALVAGASESTAKSALRAAARALTAAANALDSLATALTNAGDPAAAAATNAANQARIDATAATDAANDTTSSGSSDEASALGDAAEDLDIAATALGAEMVFEPINVLISSGAEEYVVVVTIPADDADDVAALTVDFKGVMATSADAQNGQDGGSFTANNQRIMHTLMTTDPGLLTVRTTGSAVDTKGTLNDGTTRIAMDEDSRGNFEIISPVKTDTTYTLEVEAQSRSARGDYGLDMEFGVAVDLEANARNDTGIERNDELASGRADYFFFEADATTYRFLTVETLKHADATPETNTAGAFFSQQGLVVEDSDGGAGTNFALTAPVSQGLYIVEVTGTSAGEYVLKVTSRGATSRGSAPDMLKATPGTDQTLAAEGVVPYSIAVTAPGTLQVKTTGMTDTVGTLYGPDGRAIAEDDNSGDGVNFKITEAVGVGQYIVVVEGQTRTTTGDYTLVVNFVEGATVDVPTTPTTPGTGTETEQELRDQIADLREDLNACLDPVETDARGALDNPSDGSFRSGIGVISGWVCAAQEVEVEIRRAPGILVETLTVAHGTSRPDVPANSSCTNENAGFGMTYNFNHLREGEYTIQAYADGEEIGAERSFEVVHLEEFATNDTDRFLRLDEDVQDRGVCIVPDFPATGERTWLRWEESTQNFVIEDAG